MAITQTTRIKVHQWSVGTDAFTRDQMNTSFLNVETYAGKFTQGTSLPATNAEYERSLFLDTDDNKLYYYDSTEPAWYQIPNIEPLVGGGGAVAAMTAGGAGVVGVSANAARADHIHALSSAAPLATGTSLSAGAATTVARSDHIHVIGTGSINTFNMIDSSLFATTAPIGTAAAAGTASTLSRSDHVHVIGSGAINSSGMLGAGVIDTLSKFGATIRPATVSTSAPGTPADGDLWSDTTADMLQRYDGTNWVRVGGKPIAAALERAANLVVANNSWTKFTGADTTVDPGNLFSTSDLVADRNGLWTIAGYVRWASGTDSGIRRLAYTIGNGAGNRTATYTGGANQPSSIWSTFGNVSGVNLHQVGSEVMNLTASDRISIAVYQNSGGNLTAENMKFSMHYLGPAA